MILDELKEKALKSIEKNKLTLESFHLGELFTYVLVKNQNRSAKGVALTPLNEGELLEKDFNSLEEILEEKSFNPASRAIALAAINAVGQFELQEQNLDLKKDLREEGFKLILKNSQEKDKIVFIGNLRPLIKKLRENSRDVTVFCRMKVEPQNGVYNDIFEYEAVNSADIVIITGAALIGSTIDALLKFTSKAKMVMISGFSVGLNPVWLKGTGITHVASLYLDDSSKEEIEKDELENIFENRCYIQKI
jgi:hypothetical protein